MKRVDMKTRWATTSPSDKAELANTLGTSVNVLSQIANGLSGIGKHFLAAWAAEWGVDAEHLTLPERREVESPGKPGRKPKPEKGATA